jgi:HEAT repeat protein
MVWFFPRVVTCGLCVCLLAFAQNEGNFSASQRIDRIRELGKKNAQAIPALAQDLSDPNRDIRVEAVKAIVKIDTAASLDPLVKAMHDNDSEIQIRATDGVINFYVPGYVLKGGLTGTLTRGVRQMKSFFSTRNDQVIDPGITVRPDVSKALADDIGGGASMDARTNAARAAGILRAQTAAPALVDALHSKNSTLIFESLVALQKIDDPSTGPSVAFLARDLDDRVQQTALETIGVLHSLDSAPAVRSALADARNAKIRRAALETLAILAIPGDRPTFEQYAGNGDADLRASALEGLGRIRNPEDYPTLEQAYNEKDADWRVHLAAAFALVNEGKVDTSDFSPLQYLMENLDTKTHANEATAYLTEAAHREDVRAALFPLAPGASRDQKIALCSILASSRSDDVIPVLTALSKDIDPAVSLAATRSLRMMEGRKPS